MDKRDNSLKYDENDIVYFDIGIVFHGTIEGD